MAIEPLKITDLPSEILQEIFSYLSIRNFTNLTSCTPTFSSFRDDPLYWSLQVRQTFRLPYHLELKGKPWRWLYEKLLTQTQLYTWGDNKSGNLGHANPPTMPGYEHLAPYYSTRNSGTPEQPWVQIYLGTVVDVQCGGWCTTLLSANGDLFIMGTVQEQAFIRAAHYGFHLRSLTFPPSWANKPSTAIKQHSTGRSTILGLSNTGEVWQWSSDTSVLLFFPIVELSKRKVLDVQAGWNINAILVKGEGITYWSPDRQSDLIPGGQQQVLSPNHRMTVNTVTIPGTAYFPDLQSQFTPDSLDVEIGQVSHFVILEAHIIFVTTKHRIFSYQPVYPLDDEDRPPPTELTTFYPKDHNPGTDPPFEIRSLAGSFRNFAIITTSHGVLFGTLSGFHAIRSTVPHPTRLNSLQNKDVVSISFGDNHFHALHADGTISSHGHAPGNSGTLGVPDRPLVNYPVDYPHEEGPSCRAVVRFEPLMREWFACLDRNTRQTHHELVRKIGDWDIREQKQHRARLGQWLEMESSKWADGVRGRPNGSPPAWHYNSPSTAAPTSTPHPWQIAPHSHQDSTYNHHSRKYQQPPLPTDDDIPPYFALKVAAGGWHSAALVLVDQFKAEKVREVYRVPARQNQGEGQAGASGVWGWGRKFLGVQSREEREEWERERWVWEGEVMPSRLFRRPEVE